LDNILKMVVQKNIKLELEISFYLRSSAKVKLISMSNIIEGTTPSKKVYTDPSGFVITTGYVFGYNSTELILPTYLPFLSYDNIDLTSYFNFTHDMQRYDELRKLYRVLNSFSQARIFQYDNTGHVEIVDGIWTVY